MGFIFFNDKYTQEKELLITSSNRAFKYGDGLFESLLVINQNPVFISYNLERLLKGMQLLEIEIPENWNVDFFKEIIETLSKKNNYKNARCKITVWRSGEGLYLPQSNTAELLIEVVTQDKAFFELNAEGITVGVFDKFIKQMHPLASCKTANSIPYVLAAKYAHEQKFDDVVLLNTDGKIADAVSSNVFIVMNNVVYTTKVDNGGVEGTMQQIILDNAAEWNINIQKIDMRKEDILIADEFFLTNAIQGIKWAKNFEGREYGNNFSRKLVVLLNTLIKKIE